MGKRKRKQPVDRGAVRRSIKAIVNVAKTYTSGGIAAKASVKKQTASAVCSAVRAVGLSEVVSTLPNTAVLDGQPTNVYRASADWLMGGLKFEDGRGVETEDEKVDYAAALLVKFWDETRAAAKDRRKAERRAAKRAVDSVFEPTDDLELMRARVSTARLRVEEKEKNDREAELAALRAEQAELRKRLSR